MADFGLLNPTPNFAQSALGGFQAGRQIARQRQIDAATANVDLSKPESILPLLRVDPATGVALLGASTKLADAQRETAGRAALGDYLKALQPGQAPHAGAVQALMPGAPAIGASGIPPAQAADGTSTTPATPPSDPNEITVTAPSQGTPPPPVAPAPDLLVTARQHLIDVDPESFLKVQENIGRMDENQRKKTDEATGAFAAVGQAASKLPYEQRKAYIQSQAGWLSSHGVTADHIAGFDPTDQNLFSEVGKALGVKGILEQQDKDRNFQETHNQHGIENSFAQQRIGLEGANVGIARGHLALDQTKEAREAASGSGNHAPTRNIGGQTYYMVGGKWYDNPEGK